MPAPPRGSRQPANSPDTQPLWQAVLLWLAEQPEPVPDPALFLASARGGQAMPTDLTTVLHWLITHGYVQPHRHWRASPQLPTAVTLTPLGHECAGHLANHTPQPPVPEQPAAPPGLPPQR